ncbi:MAG: tetratricopeptide repeat protein, partial [Anaerolineae bacterium]|nr:tetratricopeptide repeat protein [Anaerolineae bacterium]
MRFYATFLADASDPAFVQSNIGVIQFELLDDVNGALLSQEEATRLNPNDPRPHLEQARLLYAQGDLNAALEQLAQALTKNPNYAPAYAEQAFVLGRLRAFTEAQQALTSALSLAPLVGEYHALAGHLFTLQEAWSAARQALQTALELGVVSAETHSELATSLNRLATLPGQSSRPTLPWRWTRAPSMPGCNA